MQAQIQSFAESAGINPSKLSDLQEQIRSAVDGAKSADGSIDPSAIKDAVSGVLNDNGIDPEQLRSQLQGVFQQAGLSPSVGGLQGLPGIGDTANTQQDLLDALFADDDDTAESTGDNAVSLLQLLENLPKGSLVNTAA
ncbi:MAG: hypothetical protein AAF297_10315 [Planctomycetota bacterium]